MIKQLTYKVAYGFGYETIEQSTENVLCSFFAQKSKGYAPITLKENQFVTQWYFGVLEDEIKEFQSINPTIKAGSVQQLTDSTDFCYRFGIFLSETLKSITGKYKLPVIVLTIATK